MGGVKPVHVSPYNHCIRSLKSSKKLVVKVVGNISSSGKVKIENINVKVCQSLHI